jgi:hypothetical protein
MEENQIKIIYHVKQILFVKNFVKLKNQNVAGHCMVNILMQLINTSEMWPGFCSSND